MTGGGDERCKFLKSSWWYGTFKKVAVGRNMRRILQKICGQGEVKNRKQGRLGGEKVNGFVK